MMPYRISRFGKTAVAVIAFALVFAAPGLAPVYAQDSEEEGNGNETQYVIKADDVLNVTIFAGGEAQKELVISVTSEGFVTFPFIGQVKAVGLTIKQLSDLATNRLKGDYFVEPQIIINFREMSKIFVMGFVNTPGAFQYQEGITALEACTLAGGFAKYSAPNRTIITRSRPDGSRKKVNVDLEAVQEGEAKDVLLKPGDRIFVPRSWL